jgi:hypothetical protein
LNNQQTREAVKKTAAQLIGYGVDGLNFAQYGLKYPVSVDANKLDDLAAEIRLENAKLLSNPAEL